MSDLPERAWVIEIKVQGDTRDDAVELLRSLLIDLDRGSNGPSVSGGCSSGGTMTVRNNPEMTHDLYFALLQPILDRQARTT